MYRSCLLALLLAVPAAHADSLSQADREALIEKLDALRDNAKAKAGTRMESAASAFRAGMASDEAAIDLYLKCVEKVEFSDQKRSAQDFREWKRHQSERLDADGLGRCLRHQLRWLVLTMDAAESDGKSEDLAVRALDAMDSIFSSPQQFEGNVQPLRDPVTNSVFARAYGLSGMKADKWPLSPLEVAQVFNQVVLPPLRDKGKVDSMREQWLKRIKYEGVAAQYFAGGGRGGNGRGGEKPKPSAESSPEYEKFMTETQPDLVWQMEEDLYKSGDQKNAAVAMLKHIEQHITHPKAREWADRFRALIEPPKAETADKTE